MITTDTIYEWMSDHALDFYVEDRPDDVDYDDWDGPYLDVDSMVDAAYEIFGTQLTDEYYRDQGKDPMDEESRIELFAEISSLVGEPEPY